MSQNTNHFLSESEKQLLSCLSSALWDKEPTSNISKSVFAELRQHCVQSLIIEHLPKEEALAAAPIIVHNVQLLYEQNRLIELLQSKQIPVIVLKGTANAVNYPKPLYRPSGDIDLWVGSEHFENAYTLLQKNGYLLDETAPDIDELDSAHGKHVNFICNGISIELHKKPFLINSYVDPELDQTLQHFMEEGLYSCETATLDEYSFPTLPAKQTSFELLIHVQAHLRTGIGLRQIIDWMMFAFHHVSDETFPEYQELWKPYGLVEFAAILTRCCQLYLGMPQANYSWAHIAKTATCEALMHRVLQFGNFGRRSSLSKGSRVLMRSPLERLRMLQLAGLTNNRELIRLHPWMKNIAWLFQLRQYVSYVLHHGTELASDYKEAKLMKELLDKLQLFE